MGGDEAMIAIGIGCKSGATKQAVLDLIAEARARGAVTQESAMLFTYEGKRSEEGLTAAAEELVLPLGFLSLKSLQAVADKITRRSEAAEKALGIPSVAEAAALAGGGADAQLIVPRLTGDGVTCAIARGSR